MNSQPHGFAVDKTTRGVINTNTAEYEQARTIRKLVSRLLVLEQDVTELKKIVKEQAD